MPEANHPSAQDFVGDPVNGSIQVRGKAKNLAQSANFDIFATAIAATWGYGEPTNNVDVIGDEDSRRIDTVSMGLPEFSPKSP